MGIVASTATGVGRQAALVVADRGVTVQIDLGGTYNMTVQLEREVGSPGSGMYQVVAGPFANLGTITRFYVTKSFNESLLLNVTVDTSGTVEYSYFTLAKDVALRHDQVGTLLQTTTIKGETFENDVTAKGAISNPDFFEVFDDFYQITYVTGEGPWSDLSGTDAQAVKAINAQENGVLRLTSGNAGVNYAGDGEQLTSHIPLQADSGGLFVECRMRIDTAITSLSCGFGLTDVGTLEEPFSIATATVTSNATDAAMFTFDDGATLKEWFALGVDGDTDATGNGAIGSANAPVAGTFQVLRIEIASDGESAQFFVDGVLVHTLVANVCAASTNLFCTIYVNSTGAASKIIDVDYIRFGSLRV